MSRTFAQDHQITLDALEAFDDHKADQMDLLVCVVEAHTGHKLDRGNPDYKLLADRWWVVEGDEEWITRAIRESGHDWFLS